MTPDQLQALAARLLNHAAMHESVIPHDDEPAFTPVKARRT